LVVIGILGLLAAMYLTAISKAKAKALQTQCASNLRQLAMGLEQFVSDNHAYPFVLENIKPPSGFPKEGWQVALGRYAGGYRLNTNQKPWQPAGLFHCPAANPPAVPTFPEGIVYTDYGYNAYGVSRWFDTNGSLGLSPWMGTPRQGEPLPVAAFELNHPVGESQIVSPADMMAIGDGFAGNIRILADARMEIRRASDVRQDNPPGSTGRAYARHKGKENVVFCDGHVEVLLLPTMFGDDSDSVLSRWNRLFGGTSGFPGFTLYPAALVPEPSLFTLIASAAGILFMWRRFADRHCLANLQ
jgi:prepilin-type processing-associated H-X9-DG protein